MGSIFKKFKPFDIPKDADDLRIPGFDTKGDPKESQLPPPDAEGNIVAELPFEQAPPMPLLNDDATRNARRKAAAAQKRRRGRASTILTALDSERLGG